MVTLALVMMWSGIAAAQTEWVLYEGNPVVPRPEADEWPGFLRWIEAVIVVDGTYHMFFTGTRIAFTIDHEIGHATSTDGINWTMDPGNPVLTPEAEGDWQVNSFYSLAVVHDGREFLMWYGAEVVPPHLQNTDEIDTRDPPNAVSQIPGMAEISSWPTPKYCGSLWVGSRRMRC
jgi:hypothetical protein